MDPNKKFLLATSCHDDHMVKVNSNKTEFNGYVNDFAKCSKL